MVYSYQVVKFQTISFVNGVHWSQSVGDKGISTNLLKIHFQNLLFNHQMAQKNYTIFQKIEQSL